MGTKGQTASHVDDDTTHPRQPTPALNEYEEAPVVVVATKRQRQNDSDAEVKPSTPKVTNVDLKIKQYCQQSATLPTPQSTAVLIIPGQQASTLATHAAKKIRRAFSMPRNPFRWSRKFKTSAAATEGDDLNVVVGNSNNTHRGGSHSAVAITSCVGGGRGRSGSIVSLNSYEALVCTPDTTSTTKLQPVAQNNDNNNVNKNNAVNNKRNTMRNERKTLASNGNHNNNNSSGGNSGGSVGNHHTRVLRRSSFRKFLNRIAQHLSASVNHVGCTKATTATSTTTSKTTFIDIVPFYTGCWRRKEEANKLNITSTATTTVTERVPPIGGYQWPADQTPGVMGLKNHGNTCFMNAVLQCLSHTDILAEYFVLDQYKVDLKRRNKINSRKFGTKGELTEQLANVLKALWTCKNESDHSTGFKAVVERYGSQYRSSTQHDAQEFLFWLLDKVHEDLNTATKRRYKSVKNTYGRPDEVIAAETLANHIRCNNSFVQAVFQAQFRSSLTCPRCEKQSNTFDPFHCISVQLPQLTQQTIFVTVVYMKQKPRQIRMGLRVPAGSPIVALREQLQLDTGISMDCMVLLDLNKDGFTRVFYDSQPVETLKGIETIFCIEVPEIKLTSASSATLTTNSATAIDTKTPTTSVEVVANTPKTPSTATTTTTATVTVTASHATDLLLLVANVHKKQKKTETANNNATTTEKPVYTYERFGAPFSVKAPRDCSYVELQKKLLREISTLLKPEVFSYTTPLTNMFQIRLQDPSADPDTYLEQVEHPLLTEMIDMALSVLSSEAGPPHIKLLLEWSAPEEHFIDMSIAYAEPVVEHESVARLSASKPNDTTSLTLEECLENYTKAETLSAEDAWRCPHCQQYLPVVKTLGLWSLPDILVVHFKRFRQHQQKGQNAAKLTTMVKFPLNAFDMSPHLARGINGENNTLGLDAAACGPNYRPSPWKKTRNGDSRSSTLNSRTDQKDTRYDLYAVCYHQGDTLETGHYTAACKNPYDRQWYKFDDQRVSKVAENAIQEEIINNEAYMLFYQRRNADTAECSGSSSNSGDHWVARIAPPSITTTTYKEIAQEKLMEVQKTISTTTDAEEELEPERERLQSKPVEIPKVCSEIEKDKTVNCLANETLTQAVVIQTNTEKHELINIEELDFADADVNAEDDVIVANDKNDATDKTETDKKNVSNSSVDDSTIFVMDEDCDKPEAVVTVKSTPQKQNSDDSIDAKPEIISTTAIVLTPVTRPYITEVQHSSDIGVLSNGQISPHDIKSHSASNTSSAASSSSSLSASPEMMVKAFNATTTSLQSKLNGHGAAAATIVAASLNGSHKELQQLSSSLKSHAGSMNGTPCDLTRHYLHNQQQLQQQQQQQQQNWHGSRSSVSAVESATQQMQRQTTSLKLRHSFSTSSNYKLRECSETLSSLLRNSANTCSKDTLLFIDQQTHHHGSLIEDDSDSYMGRSLWISPVTPHKLITVSPKN